MVAPPRPSRISIAADVTPDLSTAAVLIAGFIGSGDEKKILVERGVAQTPSGPMPDHRAGLAWIVPRLKELKLAHRVAAMVIDPLSPAACLLTEAEKAGLDITTPTTRDIGQAFGFFLNGIADRKIVHMGKENPELRAAVAGAVRRDIGDGQYTWSRRLAVVDISPLCAATLAVWGAHKFGRGYDLRKSIA